MGLPDGRPGLDDGKTKRSFVTFLFDFVRQESNRGLTAQRLANTSGGGAVRRSRAADVEGLFD